MFVHWLVFVVALYFGCNSVLIDANPKLQRNVCCQCWSLVVTVVIVIVVVAAAPGAATTTGRVATELN